MATLSKEGVGGRENWHSGENKATTKRGKRRGRQKDLPDFVPRLNENMANGLEFKSGFSKAASCIIKEDQAKRRKQKQDERARAIAEQRERNRDTQLIAATTQAKQKAEAHIKAEEEQLARRKKKAQELDQLLVSLRAGDVKQEEFPLEYADRIQRIVKRKVPHTTEADRHHIRELAGEFTQVEIARKTGFTQSTISNAGNRKKGQKPTLDFRESLQKEMEEEASRYRFLFHQRSCSDVAKWINTEFGVTVCTNTIQRHLGTLGVSHGNLQPIPSGSQFR